MTKDVVLDVSYTTRFKRDYKKAVKQRKDLELLNTVVNTLRHQHPIATKFRDHALSNNWLNHRELHLTPDWLLNLQAALTYCCGKLHSMDQSHHIPL